MKKLFLVLCVLLTAVSVFADYSYYLTGIVTMRPFGTAIEGAAVVLTIDWGGGIQTTHTATSGEDGSYSFRLSTDDKDFKSRNMTLRATQSIPYATGNRQWYCQSYSETKDVSIAMVLLGRDSLIGRADPMPFVMPGDVLVSPVYIYDPLHLEINEFHVTLGFEFEDMQLQGVMIDPVSPFEITEALLIEPGKLLVGGRSKSGTPAPVPDFPAESFFDVFYEITLSGEPAQKISSIIVSEETELVNTITGDNFWPYPFESDFMIGQPQTCQPYLLIDNQTQWQEGLVMEWPRPSIRPFNEAEWNDYWQQLQGYLEEGQPYPGTEFVPPELYVYEGDDEPGDDEPDDAGLVMKWGDSETPDGNYAGAWKYDYGLDPDLSNAVITVQVTPPGPSGITQISLGLQDVNGNIRSWWWNVPAGIPYGGPTTVTIDTTMTGLNATNPPAGGYASNPAFDLTQVQQILADENAAWVANSAVPAPGQSLPGLWNYWHNLTVAPKLPAGGANSKWFVKYSQPPEEMERGLILGWDEPSVYDPPQPFPIMADDWQCTDERPVTDIHWWGSFKGWTQPHLPPVVPSAFHIGIWTNVPAGMDKPYSHPGVLVWENTCDSAVWNFAGYDVDPRCDDPQYPCEENEACFQWAQFLSQDEWFRQKPNEDGVPNIYWISIAAVYPAGIDLASPGFYPWGWKTRPHVFEDDAVRITDATVWPPLVGAVWTGGEPVEFPAGISWDLAFELTTNEPAYADAPIPGDIGGPAGPGPDGAVDLFDFAIMAGNWLRSSP